MTTCRLAYPCRVEVSRLKHHVCSGIVCTGALSAEYTGYAHWFLGVADSEVVVREFMLFAVESDKRSALWHCLYHNLMLLHHVCVEAVHRLTISHHDIVCDVNDIVNRTDADDVQSVLQPLRRFLHLAVGNGKSYITAASLCILNHNLDRTILVIDGESVA